MNGSWRAWRDVTSDAAKKGGGGGGHAATVFAKVENWQALTMILCQRIFVKNF